MRKIDPKEMEGNVFVHISDGWGLLTAGKPDQFNTMTVSWGTMGWLWKKPVCNVFVRQSRYTHKFVEENDCLL